MLKAFLNRSLRRCFDEVFIDPDFTFHLNFLSAGTSNLTFENQRLKPDLFDVLLQPLRLVYGSVGQISVDGLAELTSSVSWNTPIKIEISGVYLLFRVDAAADAERIQFLRKVLLELLSTQGLLSVQGQALLGELLARLLQTRAPFPDLDNKKRRAMLLRGLTLLFRYTNLTVKGVHIRLETEKETAGRLVGTLGASLAVLHLQPARESQRPALSASDALLLSCNIKTLQVYCDYDRPSYVYADASDTLQAFLKKDTHVALVMPLNAQLVFAAELQRRGQYVVPSVTLACPAAVMCCDARQAAVVAQLLQELCDARRRGAHLSRVSSLWGGGNMPRALVCTGLHLLPSLVYQGKTFPEQVSVPTGRGGLATFCRRRQQSIVKGAAGKQAQSSLSSSSSSNPWARAMWRHVLRLVLNDVRRAVPLGRWREVARYAYFRRQYAFLYSRLLRRTIPKTQSGTSLNAAVEAPLVLPLPSWPPFAEDAEVGADKAVVGRLIVMEMALPLAAILQFRLVATIIAHVEERNLYLARKRRTTPGGGAGTWESPLVLVVWRDILRLQLALLRISEGKSLWRSIMGKAEEEEDDDDEGKNDVPLSQLLDRLVGDEEGPVSGKPAPPSAQTSARPALSAAQVAISTNLDFVQHAELSAIPRGPPSQQKKHGSAGSLALTPAEILEATQWVTERHVSPVKLLLPCVSVVVDEIVAHLRHPVVDGRRATLATLLLRRGVLSMLVSQSDRGPGGGMAGALFCLRVEAQEALASVAQLAPGSASPVVSNTMLPLARSLPSSGANAVSLCLVVDISDDLGIAGDLSVHLPDLHCTLSAAVLATFSVKSVRESLQRCLTEGGLALRLGSNLAASPRRLVGEGDGDKTAVSGSAGNSRASKPRGDFVSYAKWLALTAPLIRQRTLTASCHWGRMDVEMPARMVSVVARERARDLAARARELCAAADSDGDSLGASPGKGEGEKEDNDDLLLLRDLAQQVRAAAPAVSSPLRAIVRVVLDSKLWLSAADTPIAAPAPAPSASTVRIVVPAVDLLVSKRPLAGAEARRKVELDLRLAGLEVVLPVSETVLNQGLAMLMHAASNHL